MVGEFLVTLVGYFIPKSCLAVGKVSPKDSPSLCLYAFYLSSAPQFTNRSIFNTVLTLLDHVPHRGSPPSQAGQITSRGVFPAITSIQFIGEADQFRIKMTQYTDSSPSQRHGQILSASPRRRPQSLTVTIDAISTTANATDGASRMGVSTRQQIVRRLSSRQSHLLLWWKVDNRRC